MPIGELSAVACAFLWAVNAVLLRPVSLVLPALRITALQYAAAAALTVAAGMALGKSELAATIPLEPLASLVLAALIGMGGGDTFYVRSLGTTGVAVSYPVATGAYILVAFALAALLLGEDLTARSVIGAAALLLGVCLIVRGAPSSEGAQPAARAETLRGMAFAVAAGLCWAITTTMMRLALSGVDVLAANMVRIPVVAAALWVANLAAFGRSAFAYPRRGSVIIVVAGLVGLGLGSLFFLYAVQTAGAAKTAALSSISPVFTGVMAAAFLGERFNRRMALGTVLTALGAVLAG
ncbi:MAG: DMT family transporter [Dehalococcoidia bacterium]|nr:DMT family transporter [Dehalococcoidia bacterium]